MPEERTTMQEPERRLFSYSKMVGTVADEVYLSQSASAVMQADRVEMEQSAAGLVIADTVQAHNSACLFLIAGEVEGDVRPLFPLAGALAVAGAVLIGWALWGRAMRR